MNTNTHDSRSIDERCAELADRALHECANIAHVRILRGDAHGRWQRVLGWRMASTRDCADRIIALRTAEAAGGVL